MRTISRATRVLMLLASAATAGCAAGQNQPTPAETTLDVWNRSNFDLVHLYVHDGPSYAGAPDQLTDGEPLAVEAHLTVDFVQYQRVTVVRPQSDFGGDIALTTAVDLDVAGEGYTLIVFDETFRLMEPGYLQ